jgi:hypothetical protein
MHYLALGGCDALVESFLTQTDGTIIDETTTFAPAGLFFLSAARAESTADTPTDHDHLSIGAASGISTRSAAATMDVDALGNASVALALETDAVYINISTSAAVQGLCDVRTFDSDGFTAVMDDTDPSQNFVLYAAFGPADGGGGGGTIPKNNLRLLGGVG